MPGMQFAMNRAADAERTENGRDAVAKPAKPASGSILAVPGLLTDLMPLRRSADRVDPLGGTTVQDGVAATLRRRHGSGSKLPQGLSDVLSAHFNQDLSPVRVHADAEAGRLSDSLQSTAFTHGTDVYFAPGTYRPGSPQGQRLISHELSHVVAQQAGTDRGYGGPLSVGRAGDSAEAAADRSADAAMGALRRSRSETGGSSFGAGEFPVVPQLRRSYHPSVSVTSTADSLDARAMHSSDPGTLAANASPRLGAMDTGADPGVLTIRRTVSPGDSVAMGKAWKQKAVKGGAAAMDEAAYLTSIGPAEAGELIAAFCKKQAGGKRKNPPLFAEVLAALGLTAADASVPIVQAPANEGMAFALGLINEDTIEIGLDDHQMKHQRGPVVGLEAYTGGKADGESKFGVECGADWHAANTAETMRRWVEKLEGAHSLDPAGRTVLSKTGEDFEKEGIGYVASAMKDDNGKLYGSYHCYPLGRK